MFADRTGNNNVDFTEPTKKMDKLRASPDGGCWWGQREESLVVG